mgnify:CR=1 FL=1
MTKLRKTWRFPEYNDMDKWLSVYTDTGVEIRVNNDDCDEEDTKRVLKLLKNLSQMLAQWE